MYVYTYMHAHIHKYIEGHDGWRAYMCVCVCVCMYIRVYVCMHVCMYAFMYVCSMYIHTCYVLIKTTHTLYYVLAAVFASWFCVLISLLHEWGHINYYVLAVVIASYISSCSKFGSWVRPLTIIFTSTNLVLSSYIFVLDSYYIYI